MHPCPGGTHFLGLLLHCRDVARPAQPLLCSCVQFTATNSGLSAMYAMYGYRLRRSCVAQVETTQETGHAAQSSHQCCVSHEWFCGRCCQYRVVCYSCDFCTKKRLMCPCSPLRVIQPRCPGCAHPHQAWTTSRHRPCTRSPRSPLCLRR